MSDQPRNPEPQASADQLLQESNQLRRKNELLQERVRSHTDALRLTNEQLEVEIVELARGRQTSDPVTEE